MRFLHPKSERYYQKHQDDDEAVDSCQVIEFYGVPHETTINLVGYDLSDDMLSSTEDNGIFTKSPFDDKISFVIIEETSSFAQEQEEDLLGWMGSSTARRYAMGNSTRTSNIKKRIRGSLQSLRQTVRDRINRCASDRIQNALHTERNDGFHVELDGHSSFDHDDSTSLSSLHDDSVSCKSTTKRFSFLRKLRITVPLLNRNPRAKGFTYGASDSRCQTGRTNKPLQKRSDKTNEYNVSIQMEEVNVAQFSVPDSFKFWS